LERLALRATRAAPDLALGWQLLAQSQAAAGKLDQALEHLDTAVTRAPDDGDAHRGRGSVLLTLERFDEARESFARAAELQPRKPLVHEQLLQCLSQLGDLDAVDS